MNTDKGNFSPENFVGYYFNKFIGKRKFVSFIKRPFYASFETPIISLFTVAILLAPQSRTAG